jgi:hypothetical protein
MTACKTIEEILEKVVHGCGVRGQVCGMHPLDSGLWYSGGGKVGWREEGSLHDGDSHLVLSSPAREYSTSSRELGVVSSGYPAQHFGSPDAELCHPKC